MQWGAGCIDAEGHTTKVRRDTGGHVCEQMQMQHVGPGNFPILMVGNGCHRGGGDGRKTKVKNDKTIAEVVNKK